MMISIYHIVDYIRQIVTRQNIMMQQQLAVTMPTNSKICLFFKSVKELSRIHSTQHLTFTHQGSLSAGYTLNPLNVPHFLQQQLHRMRHLPIGPHHHLLPISQPASSLTPTDSYIDAIPNGCHRFISTDDEYFNFTNTTSASYGIIFPVQTNDEDADGVWVTSLGFHIDFNQLVPFSSEDDGTIDYEVYTLREEGYYADPDRNSDGTPQDYDYRGNFTQWKLVASGTVSKSFLSFYSYNNNQGESEVGTHFYQIPWDRFEPTYIPSNGDVQSFYLTLNSGSLVYRELSQKQSIGKIQKDDNYQRNYEGPSQPPFLLIGEVVIGYPFNIMPFLYTPKQFVGKIYYQIECPSENPSISPSEPPSISLHPSPMLTFQPSEAPTRVSSETPSFQPSISMKPHSTINSSTTASSLTNSWRLLIQWFMLGLLSIKIAVGS